MKYRMLLGADTLEGLVKFYNEVYCKDWVAKKDEKGVLRLYNTRLNKFSQGIIQITKNRAKYVIEET